MSSVDSFASAGVTLYKFALPHLAAKSYTVLAVFSFLVAMTLLEDDAPANSARARTIPQTKAKPEQDFDSSFAEKQPNICLKQGFLVVGSLGFEPRLPTPQAGILDQ